MTVRREVEVTHFIDTNAIRPLHLITLMLCTLLGMCDGFDNQALAFTLPALARQWGLEVSAFAPVFSAGLFGVMIGTALLGQASDRIGRRQAILIAATWFGFFTLITPAATSLLQLGIIRFLGGLGIGGLLPAMISLVSESSPQRQRSTFVNWVLVGLPIGGFFGGFLGAYMIPQLGWEAVYYFGGTVSLGIAAVAAIWLPESLPFTVTKFGQTAEANRIAVRMDPTWSATGEDTFVLRHETGRKYSVRDLFGASLVRMTLLFWVAEFIMLGLYFMLVNWTPSLLRENGIPLSTAILGTSALNLGGIAGGLVLGPLCQRWGTRNVVAGTFVLAAFAIAVMANAGDVIAIMMPALFLAGAGAIGGQAAVVTYIGLNYPTVMRSTGIGWALTMGRIGSILSPILVGMPLARGWSVHEILLLPIVPALIGSICIFLARPRASADATEQV